MKDTLLSLAALSLVGLGCLTAGAVLGCAAAFILALFSLGFAH